MTDTLTALEAAKYQLERDAVWIGGDDSQYGYSEDIIGAINETVGKIDEALAPLSEPFDPAKHLEGWVKDGDHDWSMGECGVERLGVDEDGQLWFVWNDDIKGNTMEFTGHIPTASFFHALCGALNIK